ncbi:MAG: hypothetical protein RJA10_2864 [Pseudomonadota bacterium]|jgi:hypothetical protein
MKGMVFTEFLDMVEQTWSPEVADRLIDNAHSATGGAYTAVGTYDHRELVRMVQALALESGIAVPELLRRFGHHLAKTFAARFPAFFNAQPTLFDFLGSIDAVIHVEVLKLYPDAELPSFRVEQRTEDTMTLVYRSSRHMAPLALGLMEGAATHYGRQALIEQSTQADGAVVFHVRHEALVSVN